MSRVLNGPQFVKLFPVVLQALRDLGGSARPAEVRDRVAVILRLPDEVLSDALPSGQPRFDNRVAWARFYLAKAGLLDSSLRGVWTLTERGRSAVLSDEEALQLFKQVHGRFRADGGPRAQGASWPGPTPSGDEALAPDSDLPACDDHRTQVLSTLQSLPPAGFERFSQRLLREAGFQDVTVTGRSGDGGIDGIGILQVNPLVSFKVLFQCKRYTGQVSPSQVRDFRGAMQGRADKGIIITTGSFSSEARREAIRDGVPPIELVDGEKLVAMMEQFRLGVIPITAYRLDDRFFDEFRKPI